MVICEPGCLRLGSGCCALSGWTLHGSPGVALLTATFSYGLRLIFPRVADVYAAVGVCRVPRRTFCLVPVRLFCHGCAALLTAAPELIFSAVYPAYLFYMDCLFACSACCAVPFAVPLPLRWELPLHAASPAPYHLLPYTGFAYRFSDCGRFAGAYLLQQALSGVLQRRMAFIGENRLCSCCSAAAGC